MDRTQALGQAGLFCIFYKGPLIKNTTLKPGEFWNIYKENISRTLSVILLGAMILIAVVKINAVVDSPT